MPPLRNGRTGAVLARRVAFAKTPGARAIALLARDVLRSDDGVWLEECSEIDTYGMRAPLDIFFLDAANRVVAAHLAIAPNHRAIRCPRASSAVQLGSASERDVRPGDVLELD